jgi:hypothetical protein
MSKVSIFPALVRRSKDPQFCSVAHQNFVVCHSKFPLFLLCSWFVHFCSVSHFSFMMTSNGLMGRIEWIKFVASGGPSVVFFLLAVVGFPSQPDETLAAAEMGD